VMSLNLPAGFTPSSSSA